MTNLSEKLEIKLNYEDSQVPTKGSDGSAGYDLYSYEDGLILPNGRRAFNTGISLTVLKNHYGRIAPRSGLALKYGIDVLAGVCDQDFTGSIKVILQNNGSESYMVNKGDKIAQIIMEKISCPDIIVVNNLRETERGSGGFGSTGK